MSANATTGFSRNHPAVMGAIERANIDPTNMTDAQLRSALMASIATELSEPEEPTTFADHVIDKLEEVLFSPKLIKVGAISIAALAALVIIVQSVKAIW